MRILEILVQPDIDNIIAYYDQLKVYRASTYNGSFSSVGNPVALAAGQSIYSFVDNAGLATDVYRFSYFKTAGSVESSKYDLPICYATVAALKTRLNDGLTSADDRNFIDALAAATDAIHRYCGRKFNQTIETRYYEGSPSRGVSLGKGAQTLYTDDFVSISAISVTYPSPTGVANLTPASDVVLLAENSAGEDWPFTSMRIVPQTGKDYWPQGYKTIAITGTWGWPINPLTQSPIPAAVKEATMEVALRLYKGKDNSYARVVGQNDLGATRVTDDLMNGDTKALLAPYRKGC